MTLYEQYKKDDKELQEKVNNTENIYPYVNPRAYLNIGYLNSIDCMIEQLQKFRTKIFFQDVLIERIEDLDKHTKHLKEQRKLIEDHD